MAECCCKDSTRVAVSCLGRCDIPKHSCLSKEDLRCGRNARIPKHIGWLYTAKTSPEHQLRCGWRPGHISCPVLKKIERHNCMKCGGCSYCGSCSTTCRGPPCAIPRPKICRRSCCSSPGPPCASACPSSACAQSSPCNPPLIRIIRHAGRYSIITEPSNITNHPSGPYPLKYVLNTKDNDPKQDKNAKFSVEAKFNDYAFDYTSSQSSFVLDFSPPEQKCRPCPRRSMVCFACQQQPPPPGTPATGSVSATSSNVKK